MLQIIQTVSMEFYAQRQPKMPVLFLLLLQERFLSMLVLPAMAIRAALALPSRREPVILLTVSRWQRDIFLAIILQVFLRQILFSEIHALEQ